MPIINAYLPDDLYKEWMKEFGDRQGSASAWLQEQYKNHMENKFDIKTIEQKMIEEKAKADSSYAKYKTFEKELVMAKEALKNALKFDKSEAKLMQDIPPAQLRNMIKGIMNTYELPQAESRMFALEYLSIPEGKRPTLQVFLKEKRKELAEQLEAAKKE